MKLPNVIYILSDEHRGQAMRHTGDVNLRTPAMDRLAREGVSFTAACANCPICTPSRGTIFSGRHAHAGPVQGFFDNYKATAPSTATHLRQHGYHTAYIGKWHMGIVRDQHPRTVREHPEPYRGESARTPERHRAGFLDWYGFENLNQHFASYYYAGHETEPTRLDGYETDGLRFGSRRSFTVPDAFRPRATGMTCSASLTCWPRPAASQVSRSLHTVRAWISVRLCETSRSKDRRTYCWRWWPTHVGT